MRIWNVFILLSLSLGLGCQQSPTPVGSNPISAPVTSAYRLNEEPAGAKDIKEAKESVKNDEEVTLVGRIGGDVKPFVRGVSAFTIVDRSLKPCNEHDDDACETPWDYCCDTDLLQAARATVKIVDSDGKTIAKDAKDLLGVKELETVVVRGKAVRDEAGNLTVLATGVYVRN
jgi:hypothetical protein